MELPEFGGDDATILGGILAAIAAAFLIFLLAFACWYVYSAYFTMKIAERLGSNNDFSLDTCSQYLSAL